MNSNTDAKSTKKNIVTKVNGYFREDIWGESLKGKSWIKRAWVTVLRVMTTVGIGYQKDTCSLHASAMTYITLVSLVPILAIMFSFTKGVGMQHRIFNAVGVERVIVQEADRERNMDEIVEYRVALDSEGKPVSTGLLSQLPESMQKITLQVFMYVENTNFSALGLIGSFLLLFSVITSITKLEKCFNQIWGVTKARSLFRRFTEYLVVLVLTPFLFLSATSANSLLMSESVLAKLQTVLGGHIWIAVYSFRLLILSLFFLTFAFLFKFMPNTKVRAKAAIIGGVVSGLLWIVVLSLYLKLQIGLAKFNAIYGTFAALPFFLAILYANWCIVLLGCELSYAVQFHSFLATRKMPLPMPAGACISLGYLAIYETCREHAGKNGYWNPEEYAIKHGIPMNQLEYTVSVLLHARLLVPLDSDGDSNRYVPGYPPSRLTLASVEDAFREYRTEGGPQYLELLPVSVREYCLESLKASGEQLCGKTFADFISMDGETQADA